MESVNVQTQLKISTVLVSGGEGGGTLFQFPGTQGKRKFGREGVGPQQRCLVLVCMCVTRELEQKGRKRLGDVGSCPITADWSLKAVFGSQHISMHE